VNSQPTANLREVIRLMQAGQWRAALEQIDRLLAQDSQSAALLLQRAQCLMGLGLRAESLAAARAAERRAPTDAALRDAAGTLYSFGNDHHSALLSFDAAVKQQPDNAQFLYNRATVRRFLGDLEGAERDYDEAIGLAPTDFEAIKNRSDLRVQTVERNHVAQLTSLASRGVQDWRGEVQVRYSLAKELEDLRQYPDSFAQLTQGAKIRREHMRYDAAMDLHTVQWIMQAFPSAPSVPTAGACEDAPIFVIGLPRSGTTLVERILGSHSTLFSAGELDCFAISMVEAVRAQSSRAQMPRQELVAQSAKLDFASLGQDYIRCAYAATGKSGRFIDKMPLNYLYCGMICRALPQAKLVHLTRHPLAVCYAMYKTLFKDGYPFSYDLGEIGQYYVGYRRLMDHWQCIMPDAIYSVSYEALVADQLNESRKLLQFCGLEWEEACAQFHQNPAASTTASASQVRRPIYDSSVAQWRHYEPQLASLRAQLEAAGVSVSDAWPIANK
jgi:tetratricopeptide (TPR) repeat protein